MARIVDDVSVTSTLDGNSIPMSVDISGMGHIMSILSNIYGSAPLSVLREYAANALDSHVAAGNSSPINVTLPNEWDSNLYIEDFGTGLTKEEILDVYATYGKSTKREDNNAIGAFGIGSKSAFAISPQFVVTGRKNGYETTVLFSIANNKIPTVTVLYERPTSEPNGVIVKINIQNYRDFISASERVFSTWKSGTVLVNGKQPFSIYDHSLKVTENIFVTNDSLVKDFEVTPGVTLVANGVGYVIPLSTSYWLKGVISWDTQKTQAIENNNIVAIVDPDAFDIAPNRETVRDTDRTRKVVAQVLDDYINNIAKALQSDIDASKDITEAWIKLHKLSNIYGVKKNTIRYRGGDIPASVVASCIIDYEGWRGNVRSTRFRTNVVVTPKNIENSLFLDTIDGMSERSIRLRAKRFFERSSDYKNIIVLSQTAPFNISSFDYKTIDEFKELTKTDTYKSTNTEKYVVTYYDYNKRGYTVKELKKFNGDIYFINNSSVITEKIIKTLNDKSIIIVLSPKQSQEVFLRRIPNAKGLNKYITTYYQSVIDNVSDNVLAYKQYQSWYSTLPWDLRRLTSHTTLLDKLFGEDVKRFKELGDSSNSEDVLEYGIALNRMGKSIPEIPKPLSDVKSYDIYKKYPLLEHINICASTYSLVEEYIDLKNESEKNAI